MAALKIVSGGQTGVDRLALDLAIELDLPHGGWCPRGRRSEDGAIPEKYQLEETQTHRYQVRTESNIKLADATLIFFGTVLEGGTRLTTKLAEKHRKPMLVVSQQQLNNPLISFRELCIDWLLENRVNVLNIAGPRASNAPELPQLIYPQLKAVLVEYQSKMASIES